MTVKEARKLLGDEADGMSDEEIGQMIQDFDIIAQHTIKLVQEFKSIEDFTDV